MSLDLKFLESVLLVLVFMDSRFRYKVSHVVMNCRDPQESPRALRALGACREHGEAGETSTCCCMYISNKVKDGTSNGLQTVFNHQSQLPKASAWHALKSLSLLTLKGTPDYLAF